MGMEPWLEFITAIGKDDEKDSTPQMIEAQKAHLSIGCFVLVSVAQEYSSALGMLKNLSQCEVLYHIVWTPTWRLLDSERDEMKIDFQKRLP